MSDPNPLELLKEELDNDDTQIKVNAIHRLPVILAIFQPDKIINELIPFLSKIVSTEEDEVLLAIAEELPHFRTYLNEKQILNVVPIFVSLFGCEETVVRVSANNSFIKLINSLPDESVQKDIIPKVLDFSNRESFQYKVSAIELINTLYPKAGKEKPQLRSLYFKLCDDDTPIIKRTAAKEFGALCLTVEKEFVSSDMVSYYKKFMNESDSIRVTILPSLICLAKLFQNSDFQRMIMQFIISASEDKSWRVRNELSIIFPQLVDYFGNQINDLVPTLSNLIKDSESEVKISALKSLNAIIGKISSEKILSCIIPTIKTLNESSKEVKANIGESFGSIAKIVGYTTFNTQLGTVMDSLMKDENDEVRLGIAKSMYQIFLSSEGALLSNAKALLGTLQKDTKYRIRECIYETLGKIGCSFGIDTFKKSIQDMYFEFLTDNVSSVRETGIASLDGLCKKFGSAWIINDLLPKLKSFLNQPKTTYLQRITYIQATITAAKYIDVKQINDNIFPIIGKCLKDKIANVRMVTIRVLKDNYDLFESNVKSNIISAIKPMVNDEDSDVKSIANQFLEALK